MPGLFVDTSGWGHLVDRRQTHHQYTAFLYRNARQQRDKIITTNYIIAELVALLTSPLRISRSDTVAFINGLKSSPYVEVVHIDRDLDSQAWQLLANRQDKDWSLVDCASFVLMQQRNITQALTADHHFEQAGFVCLLK
jgi:uncharacterized protein